MTQQKYLRPVKQLGCERHPDDAGMIVVVMEDHSADIHNQHTLKTGEPLRGFLHELPVAEVTDKKIRVGGWRFLYHPDGDRWLIRDTAAPFAGAQHLINMPDGSALISLSGDAILSFADGKQPFRRYTEGKKLDWIVEFEPEAPSSNPE